jgi:hypothetical protein
LAGFGLILGRPIGAAQQTDGRDDRLGVQGVSVSHRRLRLRRPRPKTSDWVYGIIGIRMLLPRRSVPEPDPVSLHDLRSAFVNHRHTTRSLAERALKEGRPSVTHYAQQVLEHLNYYGE